MIRERTATLEQLINLFPHLFKEERIKKMAE
jgi:hypothetical protein